MKRLPCSRLNTRIQQEYTIIAAEARDAPVKALILGRNAGEAFGEGRRAER
jgi:hypothetical protein